MKKQCKNTTIREYKRRYNTVENIHQVISPRERVILVRETGTMIKNQRERFLTLASCPITKASNNSHFHSSHFLAFFSQPISELRVTWSLYHKDSTMSRPPKRVVQGGGGGGGWGMSGNLKNRESWITEV